MSVSPPPHRVDMTARPLEPTADRSRLEPGRLIAKQTFFLCETWFSRWLMGLQVSRSPRALAFEWRQGSGSCFAFTPRAANVATLSTGMVGSIPILQQGMLTFN